MATSKAVDTEYKKDEFPNVALPIFSDALKEETARIREQVLGPGIDPEPCPQDIRDFSLDTVVDGSILGTAQQLREWIPRAPAPRSE